MKQNAYSRRTAKELREKLGYILLYEVADPDLALVTVTGVEVSVDRSLAKVYVSCDADGYDEALAALERAKGRIRSLLGHALGWRTTPELAFFIDTSSDEAERIGRALQDVPPTMGVEKDEFGYPLPPEGEDDAAATPEGGALDQGVDAGERDEDGLETGATRDDL